MERLPSSDLERVRQFLEEMAVPCDLSTFSALILPAVQRLIPSVVVCYAQIDPMRKRVVAQETYPALSSYSDGSFDQYMFDHPVFQEWARTGDASAARTSDFYSARQWHEFGLYQHVYKQWGCEDSLAIGLPAPEGLLACICNERDKAFTDRERLLLDIVRPHLAQTYRSAELFSLLGIAAGNQGLPTMIVDRKGRPIFAPEATWKLLEEYFPEMSGPTWSLPDKLSAWLVGQLMGFRQGREVPQAAAPLVVEKTDGRTLTLRVLLGQVTGEQAVLAIHEKRPEPLEALASELGLTPREQEVLVEASRGRTTAEIADVLFISRRTVEKHLENIYGKLGVYSRGAAVAKALLRAEGLS